jgi:hypothetical protein
VTAEEVAATFEFARPGFTLIAYEEVALPVYRLRVRALVLERTPIETIQGSFSRASRPGSHPPQTWPRLWVCPTRW